MTLFSGMDCGIHTAQANNAMHKATFYLKVPDTWIIPADALQGMVLGYLSHIVADMLTPAGVPLLWPCRWRFRLPILAPRKGNQLERFLWAKTASRLWVNPR